MKIILIGASGFIGRNLVPLLLEHELTVLSRDAKGARGKFPDGVAVCDWDTRDSAKLAGIIDGADAVINLAGQNVGEKLWTHTQQKRIRESRVLVGQAITKAFELCDHAPKQYLVSAGISVYPHSYTQTYTEALLGEPTNGFLAQVSRDWEAASVPLVAMGVRRVLLRTGIVLGTEDGMLKKLLPVFRAYGGGYLGNGKQWLSWIHIADQVAAIKFLLDHPSASGTFNLTAPTPVRMKEFARVLGQVLHRPSWFHVPSPVLKLAFGKMARETILASQKVIPQRLLDLGFNYRYPNLQQSLCNLLH